MYIYLCVCVCGAFKFLLSHWQNMAEGYRWRARNNQIKDPYLKVYIYAQYKY
jgi:hypothetical protein